MELSQKGSEIYVPDGLATGEALQRTTHLAVGAHQDDIPIMAFDGILKCHGHNDKWFSGVTVTDGAGSPRSGPYASHSDAEMSEVRRLEERAAGAIGQYSAVVQMWYPSGAIKSELAAVDELAKLLSIAQPKVVYTHNLADKHDTHVAVALRTIAAIRKLPQELRPEAVYGCEVWRNLDWMADAQKVAFDVSGSEDLAAAVLEVYKSQISGGKRYDLATAGRRLANATFSESHEVDTSNAVSYAMDLTPLTLSAEADCEQYVDSHVERLRSEVSTRIRRMQIPKVVE